MRKFILIISLLLASVAMRADEGMWMINMIDSALQKQMRERGLALEPGEIYNADAPGAGLADAVVSLEFSCTGSMISDEGLLITNHHCAYNDVFRMSTPEHNYLEEGFWALTSDREVPIEGKKVFFLRRVLDVTDEAMEIKDSLNAAGTAFGLRKLSYIMENRYSRKTGLEAGLSSMWAGTKYYLALYEVYSDVRLVAAPAVNVAAFGGDTDNWQWPQHKCDFALYRVYTSPDGSPAEYSSENVPLHPQKVLTISRAGYRPGDFTMVIGYPGRTDRYSGSAKIAFQQNVTLPITNEVRERRMEIIRKWMNADPEIRLKYSDFYFSLGNVQGYDKGKAQCFKRFSVAERKAGTEERMQEWIDASEERRAEWHDLLPDLKAKYEAEAALQKNLTWFRETLVIGTRVAVNAMKMHSRKYKTEGEEVAKDYDALDMRVERDLFRYCVEAWFEHADTARVGAFQKEVLSEFTGEDGSVDYDAMTARLWDGSWLTDLSRLGAMEGREAEEFEADSLYRFFSDVSFADLNREIFALQGEPRITELETQYRHALYAMREDMDEPQYPDANSTMRLSYGRVSELEPRDGVLTSWRSTTRGLLEKYNPDDYEFRLDERQKELLSTSEVMPVDFLTDNDITGGNSGSPVLNSKGELIGLAFDGNPESLASDACYVPGYNMCVCVDIRYVLFILDRYAGMTRILDELHFSD